MSAQTLQIIEQLSVAERIQLVEDIWDSIAQSPKAIEVTEAQKQELDVRLEAHARNPARGSTWAQAKARIQSH